MNHNEDTDRSGSARQHGGTVDVVAPGSGGAPDGLTSSGRVGNRLAPCDIPAIIGHNIRSWREFNGYPLKYLAAEIGMSVAICSQWENGRRYPSAVHLARLARIVNCRPSCLLCEDFPQRLSGWQAGLTHRKTAACRPGSKGFRAIVARHGKKVGKKLDGTLAGRRGVGSVGERG